MTWQLALPLTWQLFILTTSGKEKLIFHVETIPLQFDHLSKLTFSDENFGFILNSVFRMFLNTNLMAFYEVEEPLSFFCSIHHWKNSLDYLVWS